MTPENKLLLKRGLVAVGAVLFCGVLFVAPCVSSQQLASAPATDAECDGSCPLPHVAAAPITEIVTADNWQFTLPSNDWKGKEMQSPNDAVKAIRMSPPPDPMLALFIKEQTDETIAEYAVDSIRAFDSMDYKINAVKQMTMNGNKFVLTQMSKDDRVIWSWITVKDSFGYVLSCGGDINVDAGAAQHDLCFSIAETLQIQ